MLLIEFETNRGHLENFNILSEILILRCSRFWLRQASLSKPIGLWLKQLSSEQSVSPIVKSAFNQDKLLGFDVKPFRAIHSRVSPRQRAHAQLLVIEYVSNNSIRKTFIF